MANVEIGKPILDREFIFVKSAQSCDYKCPLFGRLNQRFLCYRYNGDLIIEVKGGISRDTIDELKNVAKCI